MSGLWITFEGGEGSGKTTQLRRLAERLRRPGGTTVVCTREPGGTELGRRIRSLVLDPAAGSLDPLAELLLYTADRAQHLVEVVLPALREGAVVLCDRYVDATLAYQGHGRQLGVGAVLSLHAAAPLDARPDRTLLFDLPVAEGLGRARQRNRRHDTQTAEGRFEGEALAFHERVRQGYLELAASAPERFRVIAATGTVAQVGRRVLRAVADLPALAVAVQERR